MAEHIYPNEEELFAEVNEGHLSWSVRQMRGTAPRSRQPKSSVCHGVGGHVRR